MSPFIQPVRIEGPLAHGHVEIQRGLPSRKIKINYCVSCRVLGSRLLLGGS